MKLIISPSSRLIKDPAIILYGIIICISWTLLMGKDLNWDLINYHYYLPYSLFNDRLTKDFFPASTQSYLNPLGYVPLYFLDRIGLPSAASLSIMAAAQSLNIYFLYKIAKRYAKTDEVLPIVFATAIGLLTQSFWLEVGNSFIDILTSIPILAAIYLLGNITTKDAAQKTAVAGLLLGLAAGLKPTNAIVAVPGIFFIGLLGGERKYKALISFIGLGIVGSLLAGGYWAFKLHSIFGSPIFPLYNAYFQSPYFPSENLSGSRFTPKHISGLLLFPLRMTLVQTWVYIENIAPDIRFIIGIPLLVVPFLQTTLGRYIPKLAPSSSINRAYIAFILYFISIYYLWVATSANGRYGIPQLLLIGPALLIATQYTFTKAIARIALLIIFLAQLFILQNTMQARWSPATWSRHLFDVDIPQQLTEKPYLFLSTTGPSSSYLMTYFHQDSVFVNVRGQYMLTLKGPGGDKLSTLINANKEAIRSLSLFRSGEDMDKSILKWSELQQGMFAPYELKIDPNKCLVFPLHFSADQQQLYLSCELIYAPEAYTQFQAEIAPVDKAFDRIAAMCPHLFTPKHTPTEHQGSYWRRHYLNTEMELTVEDGNIVARRSYSMISASLGKLQSWVDGDIPAGATRLCTADFDRTDNLSKFIDGN